MRIVVANLSAAYSGRGETVLSPYNRLVVYKKDGSVSIHNEKGFKPLNYMTATSEVIETYNEEGELVWTFHAKNETLTITFHEIFDEANIELGLQDPGFSSRDKTEAQLQEWLSANIDKFIEGARFVEREHQTGDGPIDILAESNSAIFAIEVKRVAPMNTVGQVVRYLDALEERRHDKQVVGVIAALEFKAKTLVLAEKKGILCITIPEHWNGVKQENANMHLLLGLFENYEAMEG